MKTLFLLARFACAAVLAAALLALAVYAAADRIRQWLRGYSMTRSA